MKGRFKIMKLIDFLRVMDKDTFLVISISLCGMQFETKHSAEFFIENGDDLNNKKILKVCNINNDIHVKLENEP